VDPSPGPSPRGRGERLAARDGSAAAVGEEQRQRASGQDTPGALEAAPAEFRVLVEGALRRLNSVPELSRHPLLEVLAPATAATAATAAMPGRAGGALERAARLRDELAGAVGRLRPAGARPNPGAHGAAGGWLHFLVLHEAYVEGRPNKEIMQRYVLSEGTFHRARRRAVDAVALDLYQRAA
jgi:hypothetical protein